MLETGNRSMAAELARRALELGVEMDHRFVMLRAVGQLASVAATEDMASRALRLAAGVDAFRDTTGARGFEKFSFWFGHGWSEKLARMREMVGPAQARILWEEGARLTLNQAASLALKSEDDAAGHVPALTLA